MNALTCEMKIAKAKAQLILDQPFFASILLSLPMLADTNVKTAATNGDEIRFNPAYIDGLTLPETVFLLAHETMHCVFQHMHRRGDRNANRWNQAGDYVINDTLTNERIGSMPQGGLLNPALVAAGKGTTEGVYAALPPENDPKNNDSKGAGDEGGALDEVSDAGHDAATIAQKEAEMRVKIVQAANAAKACGKLSTGIERIVKTLIQPYVDWRAVLRRFLSERAKTDLSYARPKRRFLAEDITLPSLIGEKMGSIVVAVDCSGSIDDAVLARFGAEIKAIAEDTKPASVHVVYFDSKVLPPVETFECEQPVELNARGGGGTAFSPIFQHIEKENLAPVACVVLTDLCCNDFGDAPPYPVLWASICEGTAPFGDVVPVKEK